MEKSQKLVNFIKLNKTARERKAHIEGYPDAATYIKILSNIAVEVKVKVKKEKSGKPTIHVVDILDKSGSMRGERIEAANVGINTGLTDLKQGKVKYTYTLCAFSYHYDIKFVHLNTDPESVSTVKIGVDGYTALWDAIGATFKQMEKFVKAGDKVLMNIYTDGGENDSRKFSSEAVRKLIDSNKKDWTVTFVGTKNDVELVNQRIGIDMSNTLVYDGTAEGLKKGFAETRSSRVSYAANVVAGNDVSVGFYKNIK